MRFKLGCPETNQVRRWVGLFLKNYIDDLQAYLELQKHCSEFCVLHLGRKIVERTCWANSSHLSCNY